MYLLFTPEYILDEAKVVFHVSYIKGVPMPDEIKVSETRDVYSIANHLLQFCYGGLSISVAKLGSSIICNLDEKMEKIFVIFVIPVLWLGDQTVVD